MPSPQALETHFICKTCTGAMLAAQRKHDVANAKDVAKMRSMPSPPTPNTHPIRKTCRRYNDAAHAHALTFSCFKRRPFLTRDRSRQWLIDAITSARTRHNYDVWAYVIMPEHVHLLIYPNDDEYNISHILRSIKLSVATRAIRYVKQNMPAFLARMQGDQPNGATAYRFWQRGGGYDRNLWSPRYIWETIDYLHGNPVRRGLCDSQTDWKWSSARCYAGLDDGQLAIDPESLPDDPR